MKQLIALLASLVLAAAAGAQGAPPALSPTSTSTLTPLVGEAATPPAPWHFAGLPKQKKPATRFSVAEIDGQRALRVEAQASYGNLVHGFSQPPSQRLLAWQWRVDQPNPNSRLRERDGDDTPLKVCAMFDLPLDAVPFVERQVLRAARRMSDEPIAAATLCYVWDANEPTGTELDNAFTRRLRMIVLRGAGSARSRWQAEERDLHADFLRLFADEATSVPPLIGIAVGADADNTQGHSVAHVMALELLARRRMSLPGRPRGESRSAQHEGTPMGAARP